MVAAKNSSQVRLISPPPEDAERTLPYEINARTKEVHAEVNKLITARIPLALPPNTDTPLLYLHGIHTFAQLYIAFEDAWQDLILKHIAASQHFDEDGRATAGSEADSSSSPDERLRSYLATLIPPTLWRTSRAEADIEYLRARFSADLPLPVLDNDAALTRWTTHIVDTIEAKPHVLLAYAWVLYMAIFSGGRWIRARLHEAGPQFWGHAASGGGDGNAGLSLFHFDGTSDGEDIKSQFKERLRRADDLLSDEQRREVIVEAGRVFDACVDLVAHLDARLGNPGAVSGVGNTGSGELDESRKHGRSTATISAGEEAGKLDTTAGGSASTIFPAGAGGELIPAGVNPFVAGIVIALGLGLWYLLHTYKPWSSLLGQFDGAA